MKKKKKKAGNNFANRKIREEGDGVGAPSIASHGEDRNRVGNTGGQVRTGLFSRTAAQTNFGAGKKCEEEGAAERSCTVLC